MHNYKIYFDVGELSESTKCVFDLLIWDLIRLIVKTPRSLYLNVRNIRSNRNRFVHTTHLIRCNFYVIKSFEATNTIFIILIGFKMRFSFPYQRIDFKSLNEIGMWFYSPKWQFGKIMPSKTGYNCQLKHCNSFDGLLPTTTTTKNRQTSSGI